MENNKITLGEAVENHSYIDGDFNLNEIFEDSQLSLIIGALNNFFPKFKGLPDEGKRCEELEELIHFIEESC